MRCHHDDDDVNVGEEEKIRGENQEKFHPQMAFHPRSISCDTHT
jgi:hypothetical protein